MTSLFQSIRWRLQVWHGLILLLMVVAFCGTAYQLALDNQMRRVDKDILRLERSLMRVIFEAAKPAEGQNTTAQNSGPAEVIRKLREHLVTLPQDVSDLFSGREPGFAYFSLRDASGKVLLESANAPRDLVLLPVLEKDYAEEVRVAGDRRESLRSSPQGLRTLVGRNITPDLEELHHFAWSISLCGLGVWLLGLLGGWWLAGRAIRPIQAISLTASSIAEGNLKERIDIDDTDSELGQLSHVLNQTFERLHSAFERQKQFTGDASHELRTPVTIILSETQRILKRERTSEEYREAIETCHLTAMRMRHLIEELLLLARQETEGLQLHLETCDLGSLLRDVVKHVEPLALEKGIQIEMDLEASPCLVDPNAIAILATNLLTNAIQHHSGDGKVCVTSRSDSEHATFSIIDDGPGIPEKDQPHIFERFYRVDKVRTSSGGHAGLGLAIAKTIVDNHGGTIAVKSIHGEGSEFKVSFKR